MNSRSLVPLRAMYIKFSFYLCIPFSHFIYARSDFIRVKGLQARLNFKDFAGMFFLTHKQDFRPTSLVEINSSRNPQDKSHIQMHLKEHFILMIHCRQV